MKNISVQVSQHDKYQVELKFICPIKEGKKIGDYYIELFFYLPRNLGVNSQNYGSDDFYNDFYENIRFKTPSVDLSALAHPNHDLWKRLQSPSSDKNDAEYGKLLKLFCSIAKSAMRDSENIIENAPRAQLPGLAKRFTEDIDSLLRQYRQSRKSAPAKCLELFDLVDEFLSIATASYCCKLWKYIERIENFGNAADTASAIVAFVKNESTYRAEKGYPSVPSSTGDNSELLYRESTLKKAMAGILFLKVETRRAGVVIENILLGISAAIAMIFVTAISFLWQGFFLEEFSISFFIVWVIAYMFKDRIKSSLQILCLKYRNRYSYDFRQMIRDGLENKIGICREGFRFCDEKDIPQQVNQKRNRHTLSRLENGSLDENIMVFRKRIEIFADPCHDIFREFDVDGIVDILRLNIRHWTYKMDNPSRSIYFSDGKEIKKIKALRDYHVNMVVRYGESQKESNIERYRLVLCRSGIRRMEKI